MRHIFTVVLLLAASVTWATGNHNGHHSNNAANTGVVQDNSVDVRVRGSDVHNSNESSARSESYSAATSGDSAAASTVDLGDSKASSAATVIAGVCQTGISAQGNSGGLSVVYSDQLCDYWRAASIAREAYEYELTLGNCTPVTCTVGCPVPGYVEATLDVCQSEVAQQYLHDYHLNLAMAQDLINDTRVTALWDRIAGHLFKPAAIVALLLLL